ncbi:hypothetical protein GCM10017562_74570 [Streptomyces roseofulvus]
MLAGPVVPHAPLGWAVAVYTAPATGRGRTGTAVVAASTERQLPLARRRLVMLVSEWFVLLVGPGTVLVTGGTGVMGLGHRDVGAHLDRPALVRAGRGARPPW